MCAVIDGFSIELATLLFTATIAAYTLMGGLGAAFYVSYFNTGAIMILIVAFLIRIFFDNSRNSDKNPLGRRRLNPILYEKSVMKSSAEMH